MSRAHAMVGVDSSLGECSNPFVHIRRATAWVSTVVVAIIVALAVPVSQLRTMSVVKTCCCPDPTHCHCPDHKADSSSQPSMRACHNTERVLVSPELPAFRAPVIAVAAAPVAAVRAPAHAIPAPHPAPPPTRPDAPS
ncbi:MAG TPA: hypothetical protein VLM79_30005 [Kofleriaceae bacterium]|nr:hypothetical protein [Kofleriaceae bacterium]